MLSSVVVAFGALAAYVSATDPACMDVTAENDPQCWRNMVWAWTYGIHVNASNYPDGTTTHADFQCALYLKGHFSGINFPGPHWNCTRPPCAKITNPGAHGGTPRQAGTHACVNNVTNGTSEIEANAGTSEEIPDESLEDETGAPTAAPPTAAPPTPAPPAADASKTETPAPPSPEEDVSVQRGSQDNLKPVEDGDTEAKEGEGNSSSQWWVWLLIFLGVFCLLPALVLTCGAYFCYDSFACILKPLGIKSGKKGGPSKKKRGVAPVATDEAVPLTTGQP